jgi:hypothetical protein
VRTRYTVWEWNEYTGWTLFLGSNAYTMADQVKRAMKVAEPQKWYGVYGPYEVSARYEIVGKWQGRRYSWGWSPTVSTTSQIVYGLNKTMRGDVLISPIDTSTARYSVEVWDDIPYWRKEEISAIKRAAGIRAV